MEIVKCELFGEYRACFIIIHQKTISKIVHHKHITYEKRYYRSTHTLEERNMTKLCSYERMFDYIYYYA